MNPKSLTCPAAAVMAAAVTLALAACGGSPVASTAANTGNGPAPGPYAGNPGSGDCLLGANGADVEVGIANPSRSCASWIQNLAGDGLVWYPISAMVPPGSAGTADQETMAQACDLTDGTQELYVEDAGGEIYGNSICSAEEQNGWTPEGAPGPIASDAQRAAEQQAQASASAAAAQASASAAAARQQQISQAQQSLQSDVSTLDSDANTLNTDKSLASDVQQMKSDLGQEQGDYQTEQSDGCPSAGGDAGTVGGGAGTVGGDLGTLNADIQTLQAGDVAAVKTDIANVSNDLASLQNLGASPGVERLGRDCRGQPGAQERERRYRVGARPGPADRRPGAAARGDRAELGQPARMLNKVNKVKRPPWTSPATSSAPLRRALRRLRAVPPDRAGPAGHVILPGTGNVR